MFHVPIANLTPTQDALTPILFERNAVLGPRLLGKAAGDQAAASIVGEIETRMRHRGPAAATAWQAAADQARADALAHWLAADYPATLVGK